MSKIAVSACLVGKNTKYDGGSNFNKAVMNYLKDKEYILICPEVIGGMSIPRNPSEISENKVVNKVGEDVTTYFEKGADETIKFIKKHGVDLIIVKSKSPSCGYKEIYDGTFSNNIVAGNGIFIKKAIEEGYKILTEKDIENM